ncbi:tRNA threonylcarbamoyladenosine biosynthesis protein TsaB [Campylobacter sp.]|uniref:tRNA threonylcarbamoyladenosine biosynthesis protein TsaB n=1 Tax=Campylobacter sp. TaxID=205 RepID=UPI0026DC5117|nr:tRNA threonylcarbamoyladenosine biosynthesis protein TsaB [Campylobacter sp.]MDO4673586.1 tRNA threonylcarbamoyladenosine biosynthesis protein TsaB [Campylobacter sp.]
MLGIYAQDRLIKTYESWARASEFVPQVLQEVLEKFSLSRLIYANGPGSYMGIKISYISLKTLSIVRGIPLFAVSAFALNNFAPIAANRHFCFVYDGGEITLKKDVAGEFHLPLSLQELALSGDNLPFYFLDVI